MSISGTLRSSLCAACYACDNQCTADLCTRPVNQLSLTNLLTLVHAVLCCRKLPSGERLRLIGRIFHFGLPLSHETPSIPYISGTGKLEWLGYNLVKVARWSTQSFGHNTSTWQTHTDSHVATANAAPTHRVAWHEWFRRSSNDDSARRRPKLRALRLHLGRSRATFRPLWGYI